LRRLLQICLLVISGWFGEWSFVVSWIRAASYWAAGGSAFPRLVNWAPFYGLTWRVAFYVGGFDIQTLLYGLGLFLGGGIIWIFYEFLKGKI
jgi:hypothetical protein